MTWLLVLALAAALGLTVAWLLLAPRPAPEAPAGPADPYGAQVAEFARELHDWDRRG